MSEMAGPDMTPGGAPPKGSPARGRLTSLTSVDDRLDDEREMSERDQTEDRDVSENDRLELFLSSQHQTVLPNLPVQPGYHLCWLTTNNPRDSIPHRLSLGYELLKRSECPGWTSFYEPIKGYEDAVAVNEMVAARIPISLYNRFMKAVGHDLPLQEEEKLRASAELMAERARRRNIRVQEGDGTADIVQRAEAPVFTE